jgi:uncharacterized membrane protein YgaE (UPF0421/DUF939 family)
MAEDRRPPVGLESTTWPRAAIASSSAALDLRRWRVYLGTAIRQGARRVRGAFVPNLQAAVAATIAFVIAQYGLGHTAPLFAPMATYLCLGFTRNRHPRRVLEMGGGATLGILLGELMGETFGFGWWQVLLVLVIAPMIGRFVDRSEMLTFQAATQSITIVGLSAASIVRPTAFGRWTDALIGTLVALAASFVVPSQISLRARRYAQNALLELSRTTETLAQGLRDADDERLKDVVGQLLVVQQIIDDGEAAQASAMDTATLNPRLWAARAELEELHRVLSLAERATTSVYMVARQARGITAEAGPNPALAEVADQAARVLVFLSGSVGSFVPPKHARAKAQELATRLQGDGDPTYHPRGAVLASLLRALTVDLLQLTGLSRQSARANLHLAGPVLVDEDPLPEDGPSGVWTWSTT